MRCLASLAVLALVLANTASALAQPCTADDAAGSRWCGVPLLDGLGGPNGYGSSCLSPNDDGSSVAIDLTPAFPSGLRFYGRTHTTMYVNTNGNVTFDGPLVTFTPNPFPIADQPMIAPYWADADIRGSDGAGRCVSDGTTGSKWTTCMIEAGAGNGVYWHLEADRVTVTWDRVGYYGCHDDRRMSFQLVLTGAGGCLGGDFDVEFRYAQCEWTTSDASGGEGGLATTTYTCTGDSECHGACVAGACVGKAAQIGFDAGNLTDYVVVGGSRTDDIARVACEESNVDMPGIHRFQIRAGTVVCPGAGTVCDTGMPGVCTEGRTQCVGGGEECRPIVPSSVERCDALDNDCDGMVDDGEDICGALGECVRGTCVDRCFEGGCPDGLSCSAATMQCIEAGCEGVECGDFERCSAGTCVAACDGVVCPDGLSCLAGRCLDLCATLTCDACTVCEAGSCVPHCILGACPTGESCAADGLCVPSDCAGVACGSGMVCRGGTCVDGCLGVVCPRGEECRSGACTTTRELPDAGAPMPDAGPSTTTDAGPPLDARPPPIDAAACRAPACDPPPIDRPRSCSCATPGAAPASAGTPAALLVLGTILLRASGRGSRPRRSTADSRRRSALSSTRTRGRSPGATPRRAPRAAARRGRRAERARRSSSARARAHRRPMRRRAHAHSPDPRR